MAENAVIHHSGTVPETEPRRRDFLSLVTATTAAVGVGALAWPFIDFMNPAADTIAAGVPIDVDVSVVRPGQQIVVLWRGKPMLLLRRTEGALKILQSAALIRRLSDPDSNVDQQPAYTKNWHRSIESELGVLVGVCTHLGCLPEYFPNPSATDPVANWPGGYFCPCHGSKYDLAGRVYRGVPAPYNLPVPPYRFIGDKTVRIGENPPGEGSFDLADVVEM